MNRLPVVPVALAAALTLALMVSGCGKSSDVPAAPAAGGSEIKVVAKALADAEQDDVTALCLTDTVLFVGTKKGVRALTYDAQTKKFAPADLPLSEPAVQRFEVHAIRRVGSKVHVATADGLATWDGKTWSSESMGPVLDVVNYGNALWIARSGGLEKKVAGEWREEKIPGLTVNPRSSARVRSLAILPDGKAEPNQEPRQRLWVGAEFGIYSFAHSDKKWGAQIYGEYLNVQGDMVMPEKGNSDLCGNDVNKLVADAESGKLLVCTQTGLSIFDGKDQWKTYQGDHETHTAETGLKSRVKKKGNTDLPSPSVSTALLTGGVVWIGMTEGLARVEGDKVQLFDTNNDMPSSAVRALAADPANSVLFVGTERGLAALAPVGAPPAAAPASK